MTKQASIAYLSDLMDHPGRITDADMNGIGGFRQSFPYFVPARYLEAYHKNKSAAFSPALLSAMSSYMGDWMMFCDFLNADAGYAIQQQAPIEETTATGEPIVNEAPTTEETLLSDIESSENSESHMAQPTDTDMVSEIVLTHTPDAVDTAEVGMREAEVPDADIADYLLSSVAEYTEATIDPMATESIATIVNADQLVSETATAGLAVVSEQDETIVDTSKEREEPLQKHPNDAFASLLTTSESIDSVPKPAFDETINLPQEGMPVVAVNAPSNSLITDDVIEHIEAQHEQFWTSGENALPAGNVPTDATETKQYERVRSSAKDKPLIYPVYTEDYFLQQGEKVPAEMPAEIDSLRSDEHKSLMVMMSFSEWLLHFKSTTERQKEENKDQRALKTMWQKEKLAAAIEEENEEIPENVFEMAVNSITREDGLMSESLAEIYVKQGKIDKAVEMYRKLSLRNPQKNAYFADKIKEILKENQS
jgi:hypothetical protein